MLIYAVNLFVLCVDFVEPFHVMNSVGYIKKNKHYTHIFMGSIHLAWTCALIKPYCYTFLNLVTPPFLTNIKKVGLSLNLKK